MLWTVSTENQTLPVTLPEYALPRHTHTPRTSVQQGDKGNFELTKILLHGKGKLKVEIKFREENNQNVLFLVGLNV